MAVTVTPAETLRHLAERRRQAHQRSTERAQRLRDGLADAAALLRTRYGATRVVLFGSLATGSHGETSDVDLAVEGLPSDQYFLALADLMALFVAPVDLVRLEEAPQSLLDRIAAEGEPL
ncbi:MAG: nucleotidyltransferase family protein [Bdellovibrio bacteriovorus]